MGNPVDKIKTNVSDAEMVAAIKNAWKALHAQYPAQFANDQPTPEQISLILAQNAVEVGQDRSHMYNNNVGNIMSFSSWSGDYWQAKDWKWVPDSSAPEGRRKEYFGAKYRAYPDLLSGVKDYLILLSQNPRYKTSWSHIINTDLEKYSKSLREAGYYGADESAYTAGLKSLNQSFSKKISDPKLLAEVQQLIEKNKSKDPDQINFEKPLAVAKSKVDNIVKLASVFYNRAYDLK